MSTSTKERLKITAVVILTALSLALYYFIYYVWKSDVPFRFSYFLPSVMACLWWGRRGIPLLIIMALILPVILELSPVNARIWDDIIGESILVFATLVIAELSERRARLIATLEEQVEQRTAELSERNQELEAYGHTISHDLLGPVTLIKGYATITQEGLPDGAGERERENLGKIIGAADRMTRLTTSLLEYAKAGNPEGEIERVDSGEVLRSVLQELEAAIGEAGGRVYVPPELPAVMADPLKLSQVFANLLGNAVKFRVEQRPLKIGIDYEVEDGTVTFSVRDNGEGMGAEQAGEIFEPFKRFSHDDSPGGGIGLATVRRAVEAWGGSIRVESVPGKGTAFYFTVPAGIQDPGVVAPLPGRRRKRRYP